MEISAILGGTREEICEAVPFDSYRQTPGMNPSTIVYGLKSMLHLKHAWGHSRKDTDDLIWGRAAHCLLFEPREFPRRYVCWRGGRRAGNDWKDFQADAELQGLEILTESQVDTVQEAALSFVHEPMVQRLIAAGKAEVTLFTVENGIQCRGRVDWISSEMILADLKTTRNIDARAFGRDFYAYRYNVKLGLYQRWLQKLTGCHYPVQVICLEKTPPYDVAVVPVPDSVLELGAEKGLEVLRKLRHCIETDRWPGVAGGDMYYLDTPAWEMEDEEVIWDEETPDTVEV